MDNPVQPGSVLDRQDESQSVQGVPQAGDDLEELRRQHQEAIKKYEEDIRRLRSSLDRRYAEEKKQWEAEKRALQERLDQVLSSTMDEETRSKYEQERLRLEYERLQAELEETRRQAEAYQSMMAYAKWFIDQGVPADKLDFSSQEAFLESAWQGLQETISSLRAKVKELESKAQAPLPSQEMPPAKKSDVFIGHGSPAPAGDMIEHIQKALSSRYGRPVSLEEVFSHIESGAVDVNQLLQAGYRPA